MATDPGYRSLPPWGDPCAHAHGDLASAVACLRRREQCRKQGPDIPLEPSMVVWEEDGELSPLGPAEEGVVERYLDQDADVPTTITVELDPRTRLGVRRLARSHGKSTSAYVRELLRCLVADPPLPLGPR